MNNEILGSQSDQVFSHFNVTKAPDGTFVKTPVYEPRAVTVPEINYTAPLFQVEDEVEVQPEQAYEEEYTAPANERKFRGKSLAAVGIFLTSMAGLTYGTDFAVTYAKDHKMISPADAYKDFTELPGLVEPIAGAIQTITQFNGDK